MKFNKWKIIEFISLLTLIIYLEPQIFKESSFVGVEKIDFIYKILKLGLAFIVIVGYFYEKKKPSKLVLLLLVMQGVMTLSTLLNSGALMRFVGPALTTVTMAMLAELLIDRGKLIIVLKKVNIYLVICFILNIASIFLIDFTSFNSISKVYFLGIDNRFVFTFIPWLFFEGLVSINENNKLNNRWFLIAILCELTLLYKSSVAAMLVMMLFVILFYTRKMISKILNFDKTTFFSYVILNLSIVVFKIQNVFTSFIKMLGKDVTLSGRTYIWDGVLSNIKNKFLIGNGMQSIVYDKTFFYESSAPYFLEHCKVVHAHNSLMTLLYRGGILSVLLYLYIMYLVLRNISKEKNSKYSSLIYITVVVIFILSIFDTIDFACLYFIIAIGFCINGLECQENHESISKINQKIDKLFIFVSKVIKKIYRIICVFIFNFFPIKNDKIMISNYLGKGYGDSGKYIVEGLVKKNKKYDICWLVEDDNAIKSLPKYVRPVKKDSIKYFYDVCTSKIWIDNRRPIIELTKRKNQFYIQTWHGGISMKRVEGDAEDKLPHRYIKCARKDSNAIDVMISNSTFCTEMYRRAFWFDGIIKEYGTPRNDILINKNLHISIKEKVYRNLKIEKNTKIIMYAPTFRADGNLECYDLQYKKILEFLNKDKKNEWKLIVRLHPNVADKSVFMKNNSNIIDVSNYNDMYELMIASDILITDYSSVMFEFSFMKKPVFLYASDIENYLDERGLYFEYRKLPFKVSESTDELIKNISNFKSDIYEKELDEFFEKIGLNETGKAAELVSEEIIKVIEGNIND